MISFYARVLFFHFRYFVLCPFIYFILWNIDSKKRFTKQWTTILMGTDRFRSAILHLSSQNRFVFFDESNEKNGNSHRNCEKYRSNQQKIEKIHSSNQCKWRLFMLKVDWEPFMFVWESFMTNWESLMTAFHVQIQLAPHNVSLAKKNLPKFLVDDWVIFLQVFVDSSKFSCFFDSIGNGNGKSDNDDT